jgi:hypothetical protein
MSSEFEYVTRTDPKTGLPRQYKLFKDIKTPERRVVSTDSETGRQITSEVVRTPGNIWMILRGYPEPLTEQGFEMESTDWENRGGERLLDITQTPLTDVRLYGSTSERAYMTNDLEMAEEDALELGDPADSPSPDTITAIYQKMQELCRDIDNEDMVLEGWIPASWTIDAPDTDGMWRQVNFDRPLRVRVIFTYVEPQGEHQEIPFNCARVGLWSRLTELGAPDDFDATIALANGAYDPATSKLQFEKNLNGDGYGTIVDEYFTKKEIESEEAKYSSEHPPIRDNIKGYADFDELTTKQNQFEKHLKDATKRLMIDK